MHDQRRSHSSHPPRRDHHHQHRSDIPNNNRLIPMRAPQINNRNFVRPDSVFLQPFYSRHQ